jgi:hypothetical protein
MSAYFAFGRMNPPTIGHQRLMEKAAAVASKEGGDAFVYITRTQDDKENPLSPEKKLEFVTKAAPKGILEVRLTRGLPGAVKELREEGYEDLTMVVGEEDVEGFEELAEKLDIKILSGGERKGKAGAEGARATNVRLGALGLKGRTEANVKSRLPDELQEDFPEILELIRAGLNPGKVLRAAEKKEGEGKLGGGGGRRRTRRGRRSTRRRNRST